MLRLTRYTEKVSKSSSQVEPKSLPPTSASAKYHSYRVYLQVCQWKSSACSLPAESWGWKLMESEFYPNLSDLPPAPEELLKIIRCNCTTDCSSARCSCQKHGLQCTLACGQCRGSACINASSFMIEDDDDEEEFYDE